MGSRVRVAAVALWLATLALGMVAFVNTITLADRETGEQLFDASPPPGAWV